MSQRPRPDLKYLVAAGLLGFVLGAFVVGSLGHVAIARPAAGPLAAAAETAAGPMAAATVVKSTTAPKAIDEPSNAVVEVPAPTSGREGVIPASAPEAKALAARNLEIPVAGVSPDKLVRTYHDARSGGREHEALDIL